MPETSSPRDSRRVVQRDTVDSKPVTAAAVEGERASFMSILRNPNFILVAVYFFMVVFTRNGGRAVLMPLIGDA